MDFLPLDVVIPVKVLLTERDVKVILTVRIMSSARKHDISDDDIEHAWNNAIGADKHGRLLELVTVPVDGPSRIIHADTLRRSSSTI